MNPFTNPFPFRNPENRTDIGSVIARITNGEPVLESHSRAALEKYSITQLRELQKKYAAAVLKGDRKASEELATIRGLLRAKGAGSTVDEGVLDERIVGGEDLLQAAKNALTGKGFKTNRDLSGARVNANYAKMLKRQKRKAEGKGKTFAEACGQCMTGAVDALAKANAADLQDKGGAAGEKAHKRLHKTIGKVLKKK
jgi:hypothetical protein